MTQYMLWFRARRRADLAAAIRGMRDVTGLSQAQLADAIHSSRSSVSRMERGEDVTLDVAMRSVEKLGYEIVVVPRGFKITVESTE